MENWKEQYKLERVEEDGVQESENYEDLAHKNWDWEKKKKWQRKKGKKKKKEGKKYKEINGKEENSMKKVGINIRKKREETDK